MTGVSAIVLIAAGFVVFWLSLELVNLWFRVMP